VIGVLAASAAAACSDDDDEGGGSAGTAGSAAGSGGSGGSTGGSGGATGGSGGGTGGSGGAMGGTSGSAGADASAGSAGADASAGAAGAAGGQAANLDLQTHPTLGSIITGNGKSLYFYGRDLPAEATNLPVSHCVDSCLTAYPAFYAAPNVGSGLNAADFGSFQRSDGAMQLTFKGWPVYHSAADSVSSDINGDGVDELWHAVAVPFYDVVIMDKLAVPDAGAGVPKYLATASGHTLYKYLSDKPGTNDADPISTCTSNTCYNNWPRFTLANPKLVSSLSPNDFKQFLNDTATADAAVPELQQVYKGYPVYAYKLDLKPGDTIGIGKGTGLWQAAGK
jgi:predicted lipoprotein with Yx(FWY)xxD motif